MSTSDEVKQAAEPASEKTEAGVPVTNTEQPVEKAVPDTKEQPVVEEQKEPEIPSANPEESIAAEQAGNGIEEDAKVETPSTMDGEGIEETKSEKPKNEEASPVSDYPIPTSLNTEEEFIWDEDADAVDNYVNLGERLAAEGDIYRNRRKGRGSWQRKSFEGKLLVCQEVW